MNSFTLNSLIRPNVKRLKPYSSARDEYQGTASVYLDANENPFSSPYHRYPDPHQVSLKKKISVLKQVPVDQIFLGNGSDEPIDLLIRAFCEPGVDQVIIPQPTYGMYSVSAEVNNVAIKTVRLTPEFDLDVAAIKGSYDEHTKLIFLCSPNNPSGNLLSMDRVKSILETFSGIVVVDEAYLDFTGYPGFVPLLTTYPNLVVLQTLSKAWGLAAIRLGMCFASAELVAVLNKIKPPYNISLLTQQAAEEALTHGQRKDAWVTEIIEERKKLAAALAALPLVKKVFPSDANFLLVRVPQAKQIYHRLVQQGIVVRDRSSVVLCDDCLRITVGTAAENRTLIQALSAL